MSLASCFVDRTRKMVSFELGKEIEKDIFDLTLPCASVEPGKKNLVIVLILFIFFSAI